MFTAKEDRLRRVARSWAALWITAAFWCGGAEEGKAQLYGGTIGFSATNYNVLESAGSLTIPIWRTNGSLGSVSVQVNSMNGTAMNSNDFLLTFGTAVFSQGMMISAFNISIINHSTPQPNKYFYLSLSSPSGGATLDTNVPPLVTSNTVVTIIGSLPTLGVTQNGTNVILNWSGSWVLQTTTNLAGPWTDLPAASSPFTNQIGSQPAAFFRLR